MYAMFSPMQHGEKTDDGVSRQEVRQCVKEGVIVKYTEFTQDLYGGCRSEVCGKGGRGEPRIFSHLVPFCAPW